MKKELRKQAILRRKNFLPSLIVTMVLWVVTAGIVYFVDPQTFGAIPVFFFMVILSLLFTLSILFANTRRGIITTLCVMIFLILRYFGIGNILNLLFIFALGGTIEFYFSRK
ncbi:hypothetical protein MUP46_01625 [Patescibacteria group bacterium]|nr:hypothetical protein [Patescibacteria group bacterium]